MKNKQLKRLLNDYNNFYNSRDFIIVIDTTVSDWKILVFDRKQGCLQKNLRFSTFKQTVFKMDQGVFENYISTCIQDKKLPKIVIRHTSDPYAIKTNKTFRREYAPIKNIGGKLYFRCQEIERSKVLASTNKILNLSEFKKKIRSITKESLEIQGSLCTIKLMNKEQILSRYNIGITTQYGELVDKKITRLVGQNLICAKDNEYYYLYLPKYVSRKDTIMYFKMIKANLEVPVYISGFKLPVLTNCGITFLGEFSFNIETVIFQSIQALTEAINMETVIDAFIYDQSLDTENQRRKKNYEKIGRMVSSRSFTPLYSPVINIESGKTIGYRVVFSPDSHFFSMEEVRQYAQEINLVEKLDDSLASTVFSHYFYKKDIAQGTIFIETTLENSRQYVNVYHQNSDYKEIQLALILTDYGVFRHKELDVSMIELIKRHEIQLLAKATEDMLFTDHKIFNFLDGIVFDKEILSLSEKDDIYKLEMLKVNDRFANYNYNYLSFGIDNNTKLEMVNTLGIRFIEGPIVGEMQPKPIAVDISGYKKRTVKAFKRT